MRKVITQREQTILETAINRRADLAMTEIEEHVIVKKEKKLTKNELINLIKNNTSIPLKENVYGGYIRDVFDLSEYEWGTQINEPLKAKAESIISFTKQKWLALIPLTASEDINDTIEMFCDELRNNLDIIFQHQVKFRF